ncbi:MAG: hypothetical protein RL701_3366 [Pseudomonadota bacterium]
MLTFELVVGLLLLVREYTARARAEPPRLEENAISLARLQRHAGTVQRQRLVQLRAQALIGDDAFHAAEQ